MANIDYRIDECERFGYPYKERLRPCLKCCICKEDIHEGESYFDFDGDTVCDDCSCYMEYIQRFKSIFGG